MLPRSLGCLLLAGSLGAVVTLSGAASLPGSKPSFARPESYVVGEFPTSVAIGDLNGDAKPDLAVANTASDTMSVLINRGRGSFERSRYYRTGVGPYRVAIGDLNGDGKPDLATTNYFGNTVSVLPNRGDGTFEGKLDYQTGGGPYDLAIGDVNGDGKLDLATANYDNDGGDTASVLLNRGD